MRDFNFKLTSVNLMWPNAVMSMLSGFKSLCTIPKLQKETTRNLMETFECVRSSFIAYLWRYSTAKTISAKYSLAMSEGKGPMFFRSEAQSPVELR
jgi:hypothetical protein